MKTTRTLRERELRAQMLAVLASETTPYLLASSHASDVELIAEAHERLVALYPTASDRRRWAVARDYARAEWASWERAQRGEVSR